MRSTGYLKLKSKSGTFPHQTEKHGDDAQCKECGAIYCRVKDCGDWQQAGFSNENLPKGLCEFCR